MTNVSAFSLRKGLEFRSGFFQRVFLMGCISVAVCGCATGNMLSKAEQDTSIVTSSVNTKEPPVPADILSDEQTIRNAVSSANVEAIGADPVSWANSATGSRGAISSITEYKERGTLCRKFKTSLESYEGVRLASGETCLGADGQWWSRQFVRG